MAAMANGYLTNPIRKGRISRFLSVVLNLLGLMMGRK